jgi:hypothetical protein
VLAEVAGVADFAEAVLRVDGGDAVIGMGVVSRAIDKLPTWVQVIFVVIAIPVSMYSIAHYGFWSFVLHMIFSP